MLDMPARRFWMMERQIDRIRAENDIRLAAHDTVFQKIDSNHQFQRVNEHIGRLTLEIGEKVTVRRNAIVAPDPDAAAKFRNF